MKLTPRMLLVSLRVWLRVERAATPPSQRASVGAALSRLEAWLEEYEARVARDEYEP